MLNVTGLDVNTVRAFESELWVEPEEKRGYIGEQ
jgi:hypothetical protein